MRSKAAITVVARHELLTTDRWSCGLAYRACPARNHRRHNHGASNPVSGLLPSRDDPPRDFMPENQGQSVARRHAIKSESDIRVAHAAAGNFDNNFVRPGFQSRQLAPLQKGPGSLQLEAVRSLDLCQS